MTHRGYSPPVHEQQIQPMNEMERIDLSTQYRADPPTHHRFSKHGCCNRECAKGAVDYFVLVVAGAGWLRYCDEFRLCCCGRANSRFLGTVEFTVVDIRPFSFSSLQTDFCYCREFAFPRDIILRCYGKEANISMQMKAIGHVGIFF
ncbi:Adenine deaminase [Dirofilaria immitis]